MKTTTNSNDSAPPIGVLITNLGSTQATTYSAVRRFLKEFLSDRRVIKVPKIVWWFILHTIILNVRVWKVIKAYRSIWFDTGSPLLVISNKQLEQLAPVLQQQTDQSCMTLLAMRYGEPSLSDALRQFEQANISQLVILPLYPQYSATTTATTFDAIADQFKTWQRLPDLRFISCYYNHHRYIQLMAEHIKDFWQQHAQPDVLLFSFHGLPQAYVDEGDPYDQQCRQSAHLIADALSLTANQWRLSFQSRLGRTQWLTPYTDDMLVTLAKEGVKKIHIVCPGFSVDCLETLEEIAIEGKETFLTAGGHSFDYIPCLNDDKKHIDFMVELITENAQDWFNSSQ